MHDGCNPEHSQSLQVDKDLGTLEKGKLADLLILHKNPLETRRITAASTSFSRRAGSLTEKNSAT